MFFNIKEKTKWAIPVIAYFILAMSFAYEDFKGIVFEQWIEYERTEGEIIESNARFNTLRTGGRFADIDYFFLAEGDLYRSNQINFLGDGHKIEHYLQKYPVGKRVTVYYEKGNPDFSVLEPENKDIWALKGIMLAGVFILIYVY